MKEIKRMTPEKTGLLVVDIQDRMMRVIHGNDEVVRNTVLLLKTAQALHMPVVATTQYVARIGALLPEISAEIPEVTALDKLEFDCFANQAILEKIRSYEKIDTWIVCGVETHICMYQTVFGGMSEGYTMWVPADAVSSRTPANYETGLERIRQIGGIVGNTEMIIYELLHRAGTPEFKSLLPFLK
ncbi:MAG: isochorismatase family protein [Desulfobulbaceae bacterium]|uniref:Isochorismatase family protein n=1 Tax=Candidatus Desulfobia pelagia TaxID=2841692 RepID=A0A8J6TFC8_9BACT|nr:isochorismatase family protein [Candidatus Desulfobia pelagia]